MFGLGATGGRPLACAVRLRGGGKRRRTGEAIAHAHEPPPAVRRMRPARRRSLQCPRRFVPARPQPRGMSSSPIQMEPDLNPQEEKHHRKSTPRRSSQAPREDLDGSPATSFKPLCPAKASPSFLELPSTQWRPSPVLPHPQASRTGKGKRHFAPDHQPQECFGLLECLHNNMQVQTQIAQEQLALLQDIRESMNLFLVKQEQQSGEQQPPRDPASLPHPGS